MDGFDCLGAADTETSFSDFLKKEGVDVMAKTAEQLAKDNSKKPDAKAKDPKSKSTPTSPLVAPLVGGAVGAGAGALLWKAHRVLGGLGGGLGGGIIGRLISVFF